MGRVMLFASETHAVGTSHLQYAHQWCYEEDGTMNLKLGHVVQKLNYSCYKSESAKTFIGDEINQKEIYLIK